MIVDAMSIFGPLLAAKHDALVRSIHNPRDRASISIFQLQILCPILSPALWVPPPKESLCASLVGKEWRKVTLTRLEDFGVTKGVAKERFLAIETQRCRSSEFWRDSS